jgi:large subunit ribosomal protein L47
MRISVPLEQFPVRKVSVFTMIYIDDHFPFDALVLSGRSWKASELRLKSWDDLNKLWYVLLKEKNMLMTQRQMLHSQNLRFPNPERIPKV